jgi:hypothetical protein
MNGMAVIRRGRRPAARLVIIAAAMSAVACGASNLPAGVGSGTIATSSGNRRAAEAELSSLLAAAQLPPGAERLVSAPEPFLDAAPQTEASPNFITLTAWWQVDLPYVQVETWITEHPPSGLQSDVGGSFGGPGVATNTFMGFRAPDTAAYTGARLLIEVATMGSRTGMRVDADAIWLPSKSPLEVVATGTPVTLIVEDHGDDPSAQPVLTKLLDPEDGNAVIADLNALEPSDGGTRNCGMDTGYRVLIDVVVRGGDEVFDDYSACDLVLVDRGGTSLPNLTGSPALDSEIESLVGPPPTP